MLYFQDLIAKLVEYWSRQADCIVHQGYDLEVGAGTFNPATFLRALGPEPYRAVYVEPSRRPKDGRYGQNPNRVQSFHQMQVILKPSPSDVLSLYINSLKSVGLNLLEHDIRFVHDDWENPTIGASGLGWEVWLDGMEVTQFTYFQTVGGVSVKPVSAEITYGLERLAMYLQGVDSIFDIAWSRDVKYGDIFLKSEREWSRYNFEEADVELWHNLFENCEKEAKRLIAKHLPLPAYDFIIKASHAFNLLDARGVISVSERTTYIGRIRAMAKALAEDYLKSRQEEQFPLLRLSPPSPEPRTRESFAVAWDRSWNSSEKEDFLLEIGSEELPASFVMRGLESLESHMSDLLKSHGLVYSKIDLFATPRRLALIVRDLQGGTEAQNLEKRGPAVALAFDVKGEPTEIGAGFLRSIHLEPLTRQQIKQGGNKEIFIQENKGVEYLFAHIAKRGLSTRHLLADELPKLITKINFPKKMRWESLDIEYARPIRTLIALYGNQEIPFVVGNVISGRKSWGHRQLADGLFSIDHAGDYVDALREHFVMVDIKERSHAIEEGIETIEKQFNATATQKMRLLNEVVHLVEWPFLLAAEFNPTYLKAPKEILISEMVEHQRNFPLLDAKGNLISHFIVITNNRPTATMRHGFECALAPRLADGLFLFEEDLKTPLEKQGEKLSHVTFLADLGSLAEKTRRLIALTATIHGSINKVSVDVVCRAALLAKADLITLLVSEFPELQGIAGRFYAEASNESFAVAQAIEEHWLPRGEHGGLPQSPAGIVLSLADKIDNLLSCFLLDLHPTSSSDPFALRRQAFGIIRMLIDNKIHLSLPSLLHKGFDLLAKNPEISSKGRRHLGDRERIINEILEFLAQRMRTVLLERGFKKDEIEAVLSPSFTDVYDRYRLIEAIGKFRSNHPDPFASLLTVYYRAKKLLIAEKREHGRVSTQLAQTTAKLDFRRVVNPELFEGLAEKVLFEEIVQLEEEFALLSMKEEKDYGEMLRLIAMLYRPLANLFDQVRIIDDNPAIRSNRLALLARVLDACESTVDWSKIQEH